VGTDLRLLLDTCTFLWAATKPESLSHLAVSLLSDPEHELYLSAASCFEIATKARLGRLPLPEAPEIAIPRLRSRLGARSLGISEEAALYSFNLPSLHKDPFDRLLVSQAVVEGMPLVTPDPLIRQYNARVLW
jgi:PIN domain nuclease of toxin-antitoxin system